MLAPRVVLCLSVAVAVTAVAAPSSSTEAAPSSATRAAPSSPIAAHQPKQGAEQSKPYFDIRVSGPSATSTMTSGAHVTTPMKDARASLARSLGSHASVEVNPGTGTVRSLQQLGGTLTNAASGDRADLAWGYVQSHLAALGLDSGDLSSFALTQRRVTDRGLLQLRWTQGFQGIPAFDNDLRVNVDKSGRILNVTGSPLHGLSLQSTTPRLTAPDALAALQRDVGVTRAVAVSSGPSGAQQVTDFSDGGLAQLVIFGGYGAPRLAWDILYPATSVENYAAVVDANTGQVLYRQNLTKFDSNGSVWRNYPGAAVGGTQTTVDLSTPTTASPTGYLNSGATTLSGPNAHAFSDINDNDADDAGEDVGPSSGTDFVYPFTVFHPTTAEAGCTPATECSWDGDVDADVNYLAPTSWQTNRKQNAVQGFWLVNNYHDHLASAPIDFTSPDNFQNDDPVQINADDGAATGPDGGPDFNHIDNANFTTLPVGMSPKMQMYLFFYFPTITFRDINGGDAAAVVYHENTHGLSNRLVTNDDGSGAVSSAQSGAMGEAWSDWYAEDYLVRQGLETDNPDVAGEIDLGKYTDSVRNTIRFQPMDCPVGLQGSAACTGGLTGNAGGFTYGDFGKVDGVPEVHSDGEIWGETLWDLRTALVTYEGDEQKGSDDAEMIITDGMRLSPPEPTFLEERNAILAAIQADFTGSKADDITDIAWTVFRKRGMGFYAGATNGSDVTPVEDFSPPPPPGGPTGSISGTVTSTDTGLPLGGIRVGIGGQSDQNGPGLGATTNSAGKYTISGVPVGTYGKLLVFTSAGFDAALATSVQVKSGQTTTEDFTTRRDWAATSGGATITGSDNTGTPAGCGPAALVDQNPGVGWSPYNPNSTDPGNPHAGPPTATITLPQAITVHAFLADPGNTCGDGASATTKGYKIETSPDGTHWTVAVQGEFAPADAHRLNMLTPTAGTTNVKFVRLTELSPQDATPGNSGADFIDFSELEVLGGAPNVLPSGTLRPAPGSVTVGQPVHFDASTFHDPDSLITGYSWDFDGNGTVDRTTTTPTTDFTYTVAKTYTAKVTANDYAGGGGSATSTVVVNPQVSPPPPPVPPGPTLTLARTGSDHKVKVTITCGAACLTTGKAKVSAATERALGLNTRTVGKLEKTLLAPGTTTANLALTRAVRRAMRQSDTDSITVRIKVETVDTNGKRASAEENATVRS